MKQINVLAAALLASVSFGGSAASAKIYHFQESIYSQDVGSFDLDDTATGTTGHWAGMVMYPVSAATGYWADMDVNLWFTQDYSGFFSSTQGGLIGISWVQYHATPSNSGLDGTVNMPVFIPGTYYGLEYWGTDPATLVISTVSAPGPSAPAPLAGTGLMSALAALAAFAMTRLIGRKGALA